MSKTDDIRVGGRTISANLCRRMDQFGLRRVAIDDLEKAGIIFVGDVAVRSEKEVGGAIGNVSASLRQIKNILTSMKLGFSMTVEGWPLQKDPLRDELLGITEAGAVTQSSPPLVVLPAAQPEILPADQRPDQPLPTPPAAEPAMHAEPTAPEPTARYEGLRKAQSVKALHLKLFESPNPASPAAEQLSDEIRYLFQQVGRIFDAGPVPHRVKQEMVVTLERDRARLGDETVVFPIEQPKHPPDTDDRLRASLFYYFSKAGVEFSNTGSIPERVQEELVRAFQAERTGVKPAIG